MQSNSSAGSDGESAAKIAALEFRCTQLVDSINSLQKELHDGLSQQVVGVAMMAHHLADTLKAEESPQAGKAKELAAALEDTKRQTFAIVERLKQIEDNWKP